jgi:hypothetical protein
MCTSVYKAEDPSSFLLRYIAPNNHVQVCIHVNCVVKKQSPPFVFETQFLRLALSLNLSPRRSERLNLSPRRSERLNLSPRRSERLNLSPRRSERLNLSPRCSERLEDRRSSTFPTILATRMVG